MEELQYELDYGSYEVKSKNVIDIYDVTEKLEKPKLNRNNRVFSENIDKLMFDFQDTNIFLSNNNITNGENSNNVKQQKG